LAGIIIIWIIARRNKINFWLLTSVYAPGVILAQAIGRWGNYFNQELFGAPTSLPWGIPIDTINRIPEFYNAQFFHPTFLYESLGNLLIFIFLILFHQWILKKKKTDYFYHLLVVFSYLTLYSILRFVLEYIRIDITPIILGLRFPQLMSVALVFISLAYVIYYHFKNQPLKKNN
jgi:phosphatidylglycerol:prolipoprotein diacylglycerol transferase